MHMLRRRVLLLPLLLAACGGEGDAPPSYPPLTFDYLGPIRVDVGHVDIDDTWAPRGAAKHIEYLAPMSPRAALAQMAHDRLVPGGNKGGATFVIEDASLTQGPANYAADFVVRLDITDDSGVRLGQVVAAIHQVRPIRADGEEGVRGELYDFVRDAMRDMNVEFEFQIKKTMKSLLQPTDAVAPAPPKVETEDLGQPAQGSLGTLPVAKP